MSVGLLYRSKFIIWAASTKFGTYRLCEQRRFRRACTSAQSRQNLRCSLIQAVSQEELSDRKPEPWPLGMAGHAQLKFVMTECSKTKICLTQPIFSDNLTRTCRNGILISLASCVNVISLCKLFKSRKKSSTLNSLFHMGPVK